MSIDEVSELITEMYQTDQASWKTGKSNDDFIRKHTIKMKKIVSRFGCIDITRFGQDVSHFAWLLVQHSNHDITFQESYLELMKESGDVLKRDIAYLTDRILINKKEPQLYGTQMDPATHATDYRPFPILDEITVDLRRKKMGLCPLSEHIKNMHEKYPPH